MAPNSRKEPRARVLSMTVRYKSATLGEFMENHTYDVSRSGMFVKTVSPFSPGTLLKFEVKLASEERLLKGVGRVVWNRDSVGERNEPAGMGVKFIKMDESSLDMIAQVVSQQRGAQDNAFDQGVPMPVGEEEMDDDAGLTQRASGVVAEEPAPVLEQAKRQRRTRRSTMMGIGGLGGAQGGSDASGAPWSDSVPLSGNSDEDGLAYQGPGSKSTLIGIAPSPEQLLGTLATKSTLIGSPGVRVRPEVPSPVGDVRSTLIGAPGEAVHPEGATGGSGKAETHDADASPQPETAGASAKEEAAEASSAEKPPAESKASPTEETSSVPVAAAKAPEKNVDSVQPDSSSKTAVSGAPPKSPLPPLAPADSFALPDFSSGAGG